MGKIPGKPAAGGGSSAKKRSASSCEPDPEHLRKFEKDSKRFEKGKKRWVNLSGDSSQASSSLPTSSSQTPGKLSGDSQRKSSSASCASGHNSADSTAVKFNTLTMKEEDQSCSSSHQMPSIVEMPTSDAGNRQTKVEQGGAPALAEAKGLSKVAAESSQQRSAGSKGKTSSKGRGKTTRYNRSGSGKEGAGKPNGRRDQASQPSQKRLCRSEEKLSQRVAPELGWEAEAGDAAKSSMDEAKKLRKNMDAIAKYKQQRPYCYWKELVPERLPGQSYAGVPATPDPNISLPKRTWETTFHTWQQQVERYVDVAIVKRSWNYQWLRQLRESGCEIGIAPGTPDIEDYKGNAQVKLWKDLFAKWKDTIDLKYLALSSQKEALKQLTSPPNPAIAQLLPEWPPRERGPVS